jgi:hypothetical protein
MLDQEERQYEVQVTAERERSQSSPGAVARGLDRQVREAVESLRLKLENLRLFLLQHKEPSNSATSGALCPRNQPDE